MIEGSEYKSEVMQYSIPQADLTVDYLQMQCGFNSIISRRIQTIVNLSSGSSRVVTEELRTRIARLDKNLKKYGISVYPTTKLEGGSIPRVVGPAWEPNIREIIRRQVFDKGAIPSQEVIIKRVA